MSLPTSDAATVKEIRQLLKRLVRLKKNWPQEPGLRDLSPQTAEALLKYLQSKLEIDMYVRACMLLLFAMYVFGNSNHARYTTVLTASGCILWGIPTRMLLERQKRYAVYALTQTQDVRTLPTLIKATSNAWGMHPEVISAITRLLPQVTEENADLLDRKAQERLWHLALASLNYKRECDEALACGALHAFTCIGNRDMLYRMQYFELHMTFYPAQRRVYDALQQTIPIMEARLKRQEVPDTLLRAAAMPASHSETLSRSTQAAMPQPPNQLLRAGVSTMAEEDATP